MFSHIMVGSNDMEAARKFYDAIFATLGVPAGITDDKGRLFYMSPGGVFAVTEPINGEPATAANGATIGFAAPDTATIDAWHAAGVANGSGP
jgi:catechol 2,3-dioxygenase-like lactoylglutathione lyase family enzyme